MSNAECSFPKLGEFLELLMNRLKITKVRVLGDEHVGPDTYASLKRGWILKSEFIIFIFADHLLKAKGEEVFPPRSAGGSGCLYQ